jgi:hypothetical protein
MRKGGSKAAPSPADLKAGVLAEGGSAAYAVQTKPKRLQPTGCAKLLSPINDVNRR